MSGVWAARLVRDGVAHERVRWETEAGIVTVEEHDVDPRPHDMRLGLVVPGFGNAHSHAFHRALRGRTHDEGGSFWTWRERMYALARTLTPARYAALAEAVFAEQLLAGWTALGEFHYVHHRPDGATYSDHDMERALADAAVATGLRIVLLDTLYLDGGLPRFHDGSAARWLERWHALRERLASHAPIVTLGAAVHSVRAVPPDALAQVAAALPTDVPLHVHLSEQPAENDTALATYGRTPTGLLADAGLLTERLSVVHATHVDAADIAALASARVHAVICPTTEADLGDGIGPARELADAGVRLALGSDQHAVVDAFLEVRALEHGERLRAQERGRFTPAELLHIGSAGGYGSLGLAPPTRPGAPLDLVEVDPDSPRTAGAAQFALAATSADVLRTIVNARVVSTRDNAGRVGAALAQELARA